MLKIVHLSIILIVSFLGASCLFAGTDEGTDGIRQNMVIDINSNGKKIDLKVGEVIQIELEGAGGTGFQWHIDKLDSGLFELISEDTRVVSCERKDIAGSPVMWVWKLRAKRPGNGIIRMKYYRTWEGSDKAINKFELSVNISC